MNTELESGSVCAGIGGFDLGFERAGIKTAWQIEFDDKANGILARRFPNADRRVRDLTDPARSTLKKVSILCGGTPCQGFSIAGLRGSLEDDRSNLCLQFVKLVYEINPAIIVWENVPGVLSSKDNAFGIFLAGLVGASSPLVPPRSIKRWRQTDDGTEYFSWPNAGVVVGAKRTVAWRVLDSQFFGVAQRRERVFVVGDTLGGCSPEILFESRGLFRNPESSEEKKQDIANALTGSLGSGGADDNKAQGNHIVAVDQRGYRMTDKASTIKQRDHKDATDLVVAPTAIAFQRATLTRGKGSVPSETIAPTLSAESDGDQMTRIAFHPRQDPISGDKSPALEAKGPMAIACGIKGGDKAFARSANASHSGDKGDGGINTSFAILPFGVRRLTPNECERLQGFPDDWTAGQSDSARYKQCGNAVTTKVAKWIGVRVRKAYFKYKK